ncbi:MAG: ATP-binding protein [Ilumatobacter sp.]|uniref:ATP-binding protein n=1 Tax=Ilumatobacter sp. TaxID=1967498 RepID=UPI003297030D
MRLRSDADCAGQRLGDERRHVVADARLQLGGDDPRLGGNGGGGAGLGLAIVRDLVTDLGGEVAVTTSSTLGGASFVVVLPDARKSTTSSPATSRPDDPNEETETDLADPRVNDDM